MSGLSSLTIFQWLGSPVALSPVHYGIHDECHVTHHECHVTARTTVAVFGHLHLTYDIKKNATNYMQNINAKPLFKFYFDYYNNIIYMHVCILYACCIRNFHGNVFCTI